MSEKQEKDRWQRKVAFATNAGGAVAGPAALWMAVRQAKAKEGGMPTQAAQAIAEKHPNSRVWGKSGKVLRVLRNPKAIAAGGATAITLQGMNWAGDATATYELERQKRMQKVTAKKSYESPMDASDNVSRGNGHGQSLVSKAGGSARHFNSEADRQRRLGVYGGAGLAGGAALGVEAVRRVGTEEAVSVSGAKGKFLKPKGKGGGKALAGVAAGSLVATAIGAGSLRRGINERNRPWN